MRFDDRFFLSDEFDSTPKYMCSAELRDDGTFEINISFDLVDVIQSLRGGCQIIYSFEIKTDPCLATDKGTVSIDRGQRSVSVSGFIEGYEKYKGCSLSCTCMVAPELQGIEGKALCRSNCPVVVQGRVYENCTEAEILKALLDPSFIGCSSFDALTTRRDVYTEEHFYTPHDVFGEHWSHWKPSSPPIQVGDFEDDEFIVQLDINGVHEEAPGDGANGDAVQVEADVVEDGGAAFVWGQVADVDNGGWGAEPAEGAGWVGGWGEN